MEQTKARAPMNRTLTLSRDEEEKYHSQLLTLEKPATIQELENRVICQDFTETLGLLPDCFVDLLFLDPPYNLTKSFNGRTFKNLSHEDYTVWFELWFAKILRVLKPTASVYICGDWNSSTSIVEVAEKYLTIRNRITWEREKGRGAKSNWKNCSEDIWFCTVSDNFTFNAEAVQLRRRVVAPYRENGTPKDWLETDSGNFRDTSPSNLWTDLSVPFWSMPENTEHPTQKPEKLLAKILLASSNSGDVIFDPFLGSGTSAVVAKKLGRRFVGAEREEKYCLFALKRLELSESDSTIQGYENGIFWERNASKSRKKSDNNRPNEAV